MSGLRRPALRWHGGKWLLAPWIISHFPQHRIYVEPFGGGASVMLRKTRSYAEVYNDLDQAAVNLFRILREPNSAARLIDLLRLTPFSRAEFIESYVYAAEPIERARRLIVRSFMGFGSDAHTGSEDGKPKTGFRSASNRSGTTPAHDWANYPDALKAVVERFAGVVIECDDAAKIMRQHDSPATLHYVDPPYLPETRSRRNPYCTKHRYNHELSVSDHQELLATLRDLRGAVVLSGYPSDLYDNSLPDWRRVDRAAHADGARPRTEVLWLNEAASSISPSLFARAAAE